MSTEDRRNKIYSLLEANYPETVTATYLAKQFNVSRQIIVGDMSTARGYAVVKRPFESFYGYVGVLNCNHNESLLAEELYTIVEFGGTVIDVIVMHDLYGEISCKLDLSSKYDVKRFLISSSCGGSKPLCSLTDGQHIHTIGCKNESTFQAIRKALSEKNIISK